MRISYRSTVMALCLAFFATHSHAAPGTPMTVDDRQEISTLSDTLLYPALNSMNSALSIVRSDSAKACSLMKTAAEQIYTTNTRLHTIQVRLTAEGKETDTVTPLRGKVVDIAVKMPGLVEGMCSGGLSQHYDPASEKIVDQFMAYMTNYTNAVTEAGNAQARHDQTTYCLRLRDAGTALDNLTVFLDGLKSQVAGNPATLAQLTDFNARIVALKTSNQDNMKMCPAQQQ